MDSLKQVASDMRKLSVKLGATSFGASANVSQLCIMSLVHSLTTNKVNTDTQFVPEREIFTEPFKNTWGTFAYNTWLNYFISSELFSLRFQLLKNLT